SITPSAVAEAPTVFRKAGNTAVALSCPASLSRLVSPMPTTFRLSHFLGRGGAGSTRASALGVVSSFIVPPAPNKVRGVPPYRQWCRETCPTDWSGHYGPAPANLRPLQ